MKIIYYSHSWTYGAYAMAAIHVGIYKEEKLPCLNDILRQWELCFMYGHQRGNLIYIGLDESMREVYVIGSGSHGGMIKKAFDSFNALYGIEEGNHYVDATRWDNSVRYLVHLTQRYPFLDGIARKLFTSCFKFSYSMWRDKVQREKEKLSRGTKL